MKQNINIGQVVDDGTGDYLRLGGQKINNVINEVYEKLGDTNELHQAGAWRKVDAQKSTITVKFGESLAVDAQNGNISINLPQGGVQDYGKVIKIRDVVGVFNQRQIQIIAAQGNTIKGFKSRRLNRAFQDAELVFVSPGKWEYLENKLINKLSSADAPTIVKKEFVATQGQTDFPNVFGQNISYNRQNLMVYCRGNLLNYGDEFTDDSDFGSINPTANNTAPVALDGKSIRLRNSCNLGDTVTIITFLDDPQVFQSSYVQKTFRVMDNRIIGVQQLGNANGIWHINPFEKRYFNRQDLNVTDADGQINPFQLEVLVNGIQLTRSDLQDSQLLGIPKMCCEMNGINDYNITDSFTCEQQGGRWVDQSIDFQAFTNADGDVDGIKFGNPLQHGDIVTVRWFNNTLGTLLTEPQLIDLISADFMSQGQKFRYRNRIQYIDTARPSELTKRALVDDNYDRRWAQAEDFFETIYPVGQIYMNANNPQNPRDFMGIGIWARFGEGRCLVQWNASDSSDADFGINNNANNTHSAGGTGGTRSNKLVAQQIPSLQTDRQVLEKKSNGDVIVGQCQTDPAPSQDGPGYRKYTEVNATVGANKGENNTVNNLQPYITVNMWVRVA